MVFIGSRPRSFSRKRFDTPDLKPRVHVHGTVLTGWTVLLLTQTLLIRGRKYALHRTLGMAVRCPDGREW